MMTIREQIEWLKQESFMNPLMVAKVTESMEALLEVAEAADKLKADMIMRADIGIYDGDHSVQAGITVWCKLCDALAKLKGMNDES